MKIAVLQCASLQVDPAGNLERLRTAAQGAAHAGAALLVCPEMFLTGYNIGAEAAQRLAEAADGPSAQAVAAIARRTGLAIVYGFPERGPQGEVYNAAQCIDADGRRCASYRKTHLYGGLDRAMFVAGTALAPLVELQGLRVGLLICYDIEFPENARLLALAGADLIAVPTANMLEFDIVATTLVPARAFENQCGVVYANHCGREGDIEYGGLSSIVGADGVSLAEAGRDDALLLADLTHEALDTSRRRFPYLADRRPELYRAPAGITMAASAAKESPTGSSR